jgi:hypothetical protein
MKTSKVNICKEINEIIKFLSSFNLYFNQKVLENKLQEIFSSVIEKYLKISYLKLIMIIQIAHDTYM